MGRANRQKAATSDPRPHWTETHPDSEFWSPVHRALARTMSQAAYEAIYGRGSLRTLRQGAPLDELTRLARIGSVSFLDLYRQHLSEDISRESVLADPLFQTFLESAKESRDGIWAALPEDASWRAHFREESVRAIMEDGFDFSLENSLWRWDKGSAKRFFESRSQAFLDEIETLEKQGDTEALGRLARRALFWIEQNVVPAAGDETDEVFLRAHLGQALPLLAARSLDLTRSAGEPSFGQALRQDWIVSQAYPGDHPFYEEWANSRDMRLPQITADYRTREAHRVVRAEGELTMATFYAAAVGSTRFPPLWSLRESVQVDLQTRLKTQTPAEILAPLRAIFEKEGCGEDFQKLTDAASNLGSEAITNALYRAGLLFNSGARARQDAPPSAAEGLLAGFGL